MPRKYCWLTGFDHELGLGLGCQYLTSFVFELLKILYRLICLQSWPLVSWLISNLSIFPGKVDILLQLLLILGFVGSSCTDGTRIWPLSFLCVGLWACWGINWERVYARWTSQALLGCLKHLYIRQYLLSIYYVPLRCSIYYVPL